MSIQPQIKAILNSTDLKNGQLAFVRGIIYSETNTNNEKIGMVIQRSQNNLIVIGERYVWANYFSDNNPLYPIFAIEIVPNGTQLTVVDNQ